ncbi:MAG: hypothetical protein C4310_00620 [Chloroflexota bacterium]
MELGIRILPMAADAPIVFVFVARPDKDVPGWKLITQAREVAGVGAIEIYLAPLSEADSKQLVSNLLEIEALPEHVRHLILSKAEGNPFFVEEVIRMLIDRGNIALVDSRWTVVREVHKIDIPNTLQGVLAARIDRLPEEAKRVLEIASVIGRKFPIRILASVLEQEAQAVE